MLYGYGLQLAKVRGFDVVSHGGSRAGYGSSIRMVPSRKLGVIVLANRTGVGLTRTADKAMEIALGLPPATNETAAEVALTPSDLHAYAGTYSQGRTSVDIVVKDGKLVLKQNSRDSPW